MWERLEEIFTNLKERLTSPFISSFIFSWLIFNWPILIGLFWYNSSELVKIGYSSYLIFISDHLFLTTGLIYPLIFAFLYTFLYPLFKNVINAFNSWADKWGENWNLKMLKDGSIPVERYLQLKKHYEERTETLENVIRSESKSIDRIGELEREVTELNLNVNEKVAELKEKTNEVLKVRRNVEEQGQTISQLQSQIVRRKIEMRDIYINSDSSTIFANSPSFPNLPNNINCVEPKIESWQLASGNHRLLDGAKWISHAQEITLEEARLGGRYILKKAFTIGPADGEICFSSIFFMADDLAEISLNGYNVALGGSHDKLHSARIKNDSFLIGMNVLELAITNSSPTEPLNNPANNPYGIIFTLSITTATLKE